MLSRTNEKRYKARELRRVKFFLKKTKKLRISVKSMTRSFPRNMRKSLISLKIKTPLMLRVQVAFLFLVRKMMLSSHLVGIPRGLARHLTKSQLRVLRVIMALKMRFIQLNIDQHRKQIELARFKNDHHNLHVNRPILPQATDSMINEKIDALQKNIISQKVRDHASWVDKEINKRQDLVSTYREIGISKWNDR